MKLLFRRGSLRCIIVSCFSTQSLLVMKMIIILLTIGCLQISARTTGQTVTLSEKEVSLEVAFKKIEKQTGYRFFYRYEWLKDTKKVTIHVKNVPLTEALDICFLDQPVGYEIIEKNIAVKLRRDVKPAVTAVSAAEVRGRITNEKGEPVAGATVAVKGTNRAVTTNENGEFVLTGIEENATLVISSVSFESREVKVAGQNVLTIRLKAKAGDLDSVVVTYSTGYQYIPKERATGSFAHIDNGLFNRSVSTNVLERLNGITSGLLFDGSTGTSTGFSIRGRSTIFANTDPLIILDNFPYDGSLSTINPNDVESITVLKDAAAASIWGVRASNGVVVINTKRGRYNQPIRVSVNSNVTFTEKPSLDSRPYLTSADVVDVEKFLFSKGAYDGSINSIYGGISPAVEIMTKNRDGLISDSEMETQLTRLKGLSLNEDLRNYYYRKAVNQQYSVAVNGGGEFNKYYISVGYDNNALNVVNNNDQRLTINANNSYSLFNNKIELSAGINFATARSKTPNAPAFSRPYDQLFNPDGSKAPIYRYRQDWLDTIGGGRLLDWRYYPMDEINNATHKTDLTNYLMNILLKYRITRNLDVDVQYQYSKGVTDNQSYYDQSTFFTRDLINQFTQVDYNSGNLVYPVPLGDILIKSASAYYSHSLRANIGYSNTWNRHSVVALAGAEVKKYELTNSDNRLYGYNPSIGAVANVDYVNEYPQLFYGGYFARIPSGLSESGLSDRYLSYYGNVAYTYDQKYTLSGSARKDESNLFGVNANQRGVPLWSIGASWAVSKEAFYHIGWLPELRLRVTNGYTGNIDKSVSAYTTATTYSNSVSAFGSRIADIINPPNPSLRWERLNMTNVAADFGLFKRRINGSIEYYIKNGTDIIGHSPLPPSTGVAQFKGNSANIKGRGTDITINTDNLTGQFKWSTTVLYSYNTDKITSYKVKTNPLGFREGYPFNALFSYRWAGLDPDNGEPLGYLDGKESNEYSLINVQDNIGALKYHGSAQPTHFGSLRNTFGWRSLSFSFNVLFKAGYYFRTPSIEYSSLLLSPLSAHNDYQRRWQQPGDERHTYVPSMIYPFDGSKEIFYRNAEVLVEKGSQVRLQDVQLNYDISRNNLRSLPVNKISIYCYARNMALLWKENKGGIDPDYMVMKPQKSFAIGLRVEF